MAHNLIIQVKRISISRLALLAMWTVILYLFTFQPIVSKYIYLFLEVVAVFVFYVAYPRSFEIFVSIFKTELVLACLISGYSILQDLIHGEIVYTDRFLASFFQSYLVSFVLIFFILRSRFIRKHIFDVWIMVCALACTITIAAVLVPSFGQFCLSHATQDLKSRFQEMYIEGGYAQFRSFGLSESLNFTYAYVLSVIGAYLICSKIRWYTPILLVMIFVTIIFNARIAFIPLIVAVFYFIFIKTKSPKTVFYTFGGLTLIGGIALIGLKLFPQLNNSWGLSFFQDLLSFFNGTDENSTLSRLTGDMWIVPDTFWTLVFGTGESLFFSTTNNSDVGYILQLNYGGLLLLGLILLYFGYISVRIYKALGPRHWFTIIFVISVFLLNFKGFYLSAIPGPRFLTFMYVYYILLVRRYRRAKAAGVRHVILYELNRMREATSIQG